MRVSWHPERGVVVLSIWRGNTCVGTMQVHSAEVPHLVDVLVRGRAAAAAPPQPLEVPGEPPRGCGRGSGGTPARTLTARVSTT